MKKKKMGYVKWIIAAVSLVLLVLLSTVLAEQHSRMTERKQERKELLQKQEELELEKQRLELLTQYVGTEDYAEYYARYRLGYISQDEIKFEK